MSAAALVALPPAPPHDPLWMTLGGAAEWRLQADSKLEVGKHDNRLALAPLPGTYPVLGDPSGSLGGLVPPGHVAIDGRNVLWLLDKAGRRLRRFDPCACRFEDVPCAQLELGDPRAIEADGDRLYIADAAPPGRVLVIDARHMALRALLRPPKSGNPWQPVAVAARRGRIAVADAANGRIDLFAGWGGWIEAWEGTGAPARLVFDRGGDLYAVTAGDDAVSIRDRGGKLVATATDPNEVRWAFPPTFPVDRKGWIDLSGWCGGAGWFDTTGNPVPTPAETAPAYPQSASAITVALDSRIARCRWHRVVVDASLPENASIRLAFVTAEVELLPSVIASLPESAWSVLPLGAEGIGEALILAPPGRYAWLRITLFGDSSAGPVVRAIDVEYPRISLRRYLPAAFGADAPSADFADRMLAIFDKGLREIESRIDEQAAWFDPRSAPSEADGRGRDFLSWLASWVGITFDRRWPEARRRSLLRVAGRLFACRGTLNGLRGSLLLWLGWDRLELIVPVRSQCAPNCEPAKSLPPLPPLILEHWKLRRWLNVGTGRLGDASVLWGSRLLGRSVLDDTARAGATRLDAVRDPLRDPFHHSAHKMSLFLPACALATPAARGAALRLVAENKPAHVIADFVPVHPRMRIGVQASIGFDAVVGCWPRGVELDQALIGRGTVLSGAVPGGVETPRLGRDSRLKSPRATPSSASTGEAMP